MDVNDIPSDSIYKFIGLGGLVLAVLSLTFPFREMKKIQEDQLTLKKDIKITDTNWEYFQNKVKWQKTTDSLSFVSNLILNKKDSSQTKSISSDSLNYYRQVLQYNSNWLEKSFSSYLRLLDEGKEYKLKEIQVNYQIERSIFLNREYIRWTLICTVGLIIGLLMFIFGFLEWYFRSQVYLDFNLMDESRKRGYKETEFPLKNRIFKIIPFFISTIPIIIIFTTTVDLWIKLLVSIILIFVLILLRHPLKKSKMTFNK